MSSNRIAAALAVGLAFSFAVPVAVAQDRDERVDLTRPTEGYTYFNRPGASIDDHHADVRTCAAHARGPSQVGAAIGGVLPALIASQQGQARFQTNVENCMVVKGWRVVRLPEGVGRALRRMNREELSNQLATVVGVETPQAGRIVRVFANDAIHGRTIWGSVGAYHPEDHLSLRAIDLDDLPEPPARPAVGGPAGAAAAIRPITPANIAEIPAGTAIVITRAVGTGQTNGEGFSFLRIQEPGETPFVRTAEGDPIYGFTAAVPWTLFKGPASERRETVAAYAVVPGRYRLTAKMNTLDFCHGSPVMEVRAGDVVFAGTFDLAADVGPDMSLEPAREFLAADTARLARVRPAEWRNGSVATCGYAYNYALEFPGAPFIDGYADGGGRP